jgi:hypothetical protein
MFIFIRRFEGILLSQCLLKLNENISSIFVTGPPKKKFNESSCVKVPLNGALFSSVIVYSLSYSIKDEYGIFVCNSLLSCCKSGWTGGLANGKFEQFNIYKTSLIVSFNVIK